jgi:hypothetical protein
MAVLTGILLTTEKDAINALLRSIGEAPLGSTVTVDTAASQAADVQMAVDILRSTIRETLAIGWKFNAGYGVEVKPSGTCSWTDTGGTTTLLNVFKRPSNVLSFTTTPCVENGDLDIIERPSEKYTEGSPGVPVSVLYDQTWNRDGADAARFPYLYLDVFRVFDFEALPEVVRQYLVAVSSNRLAKNLLGSVERSQFTADDVAVAWGNLNRAYGIRQRNNIFNNPGPNEFFGGRPNPMLRPRYPVKRGPQ